MKRILLASVAAAILIGPALAQTTIRESTGTAPAGVTVTVAPEQRTKIKRYVTERRVAPVKIKERVTVGATLPGDVDLLEVPADWGPDLVRYRYVYHEDDIYLVEPSSRRVVHVID